MSSLLVLQSKDKIIMASDTASSAKIDNRRVRVSGDISKIITLNDITMFVSGNLFIRDFFNEILREEDTLFTIEQKLKRYILPLCGEYSLEVVVSQLYDDKSEITSFSSYNRFDSVKRVVDTEETVMLTAGIKTKEIADTFEEEIRVRSDINDALIATYKSNISESIGGSLDIYTVTQKNRKFFNSPLDNIKNYDSIVNEIDTSLIVGERIKIFRI